MTHDARFLDINRFHLGGRMDHRAALILAASLLCGSVHAGYAQAVPPPGWGSGGGLASGAGGSFNYGAAANTATIASGTVRTNAALNVGGRAVTFPAAMRLAANAPRIAAAAIYLHPAVRTGVAIASLLGLAGLIYDPQKKTWGEPDPDAVLSDGHDYTVARSTAQGQLIAVTSASFSSACSQWGPKFAAAIGHTFVSVQQVDASTCRVNTKAPAGYDDYWHANPVSKGTSQCQAGWYVTPAGCTLTPQPRPVTQEEFIRKLEPHPLPDAVPRELPYPLPVDVPFFDPVFIPTGDPVKNPNYNPSAPPSPQNQPYNQPGVRVSPAPTANAPWQVNLEPVNRPVDTPVSNPNPVVDGVEAGKDDSPKPDDRDFCDKHPDVLACQKLDEPEDPGKLPVKEVEFNFKPESGFAGSASCPAPTTVNIHGNVISISWQPFCNSLDMIRPFMLAMAWLSAAFIMLGARQE